MRIFKKGENPICPNCKSYSLKTFWNDIDNYQIRCNNCNFSVEKETIIKTVNEWIRRGEEIKKNRHLEFQKMFIEEIREEMIKQNLTQKELSSRSGITPGAIGHLLNGTRNLRFQTIEKICYGLGFKPVLCLGNKIDENEN